MKPYATSHLPGRSLEAFNVAQRVVELLPDDDHEGNVFRCHEVARVASFFLSQRSIPHHVVDGKFGLVDHSWLEIPHPTGQRGYDLLEVYAVAALPPVQIFDVTSVGVSRSRTDGYRPLGALTLSELRLDAIGWGIRHVARAMANPNVLQAFHEVPRLIEMSQHVPLVAAVAHVSRQNERDGYRPQSERQREVFQHFAVECAEHCQRLHEVAVRALERNPQPVVILAETTPKPKAN